MVWHREVKQAYGGIFEGYRQKGKCVTHHRTKAPENPCLFLLWDFPSDVLQASSVDKTGK
jgi:hypothetical protein